MVLGIGEKPKRDTAPKRGRPRAAARQPSKAEQKDARTILGFLVGVTSFGLGYLGAFNYRNAYTNPDGTTGYRDPEHPEVPILADPITEEEAQLVVDALYGELALNPALVIQAAALAHFGGPHGELVRVAALLAIPRLANRGILPPAIGAMLTMSLIGIKEVASGDAYSSEDFNPGSADATVPMAPGPDDGNHWGNGNGQIDGSFETALDPGLLLDPANGAGPGDELRPRRRSKQRKSDEQSEIEADFAAAQVAEPIHLGPDNGAGGAE